MAEHTEKDAAREARKAAHEAEKAEAKAARDAEKAARPRDEDDGDEVVTESPDVVPPAPAE